MNISKTVLNVHMIGVFIKKLQFFKIKTYTKQDVPYFHTRYYIYPMIGIYF